MKAYLVLDIRVTDLNTFMNYVEQIPEHLQRHGGTYLVEGVRPEVIEGKWKPETLVILEFPSEQNARAFLTDPLVQSLFALRHSSTDGGLVLVRGGSWRDAPNGNE